MDEIHEGRGAQWIGRLVLDADRDCERELAVLGLLRDRLLMLIEEGAQRLLLGLGRLAREQDLIEPIDARGLVGTRFVDDAAGERLRPLEDR